MSKESEKFLEDIDEGLYRLDIKTMPKQVQEMVADVFERHTKHLREIADAAQNHVYWTTAGDGESRVGSYSKLMKAVLDGGRPILPVRQDGGSKE